MEDKNRKDGFKSLLRTLSVCKNQTEVFPNLSDGIPKRSRSWTGNWDGNSNATVARRAMKTVSKTSLCVRWIDNRESKKRTAKDGRYLRESLTNHLSPRLSVI